MKRFLCFLICLFSVVSAKQAAPPVDISFLVADLKYNEKQGVKLCEIQQASISMFKGYDYIYKKDGLIGENLCQVLSQFGNNFWFVNSEINYPASKKRFVANGWKGVGSRSELLKNRRFVEQATKSVHNPYNILDYHAIVYMRPANISNLDAFLQKYPGMIIFDRANTEYWKDKYKMSQLFLNHPALEQVKPKWGFYKKKYSKELVEQIKSEIDSKMLVIKPRRGAEGKGIIILEAVNLEKTLKYIFGSKEFLEKNPDKAYNYWAVDFSDSFIVEEYVESDPVKVPYFNNRSFNCTMRIVFALIYHEEAPQLHYLGEYWIVPDKSIDQRGSLNDKNKASMSHPHICAIDPVTRYKAKELLREPLLLMYKRMLQLDEATLEEGIESCIVTGMDREV